MKDFGGRSRRSRVQLLWCGSVLASAWAMVELNGTARAFCCKAGVGAQHSEQCEQRSPVAARCLAIGASPCLATPRCCSHSDVASSPVGQQQANRVAAAFSGRIAISNHSRKVERLRFMSIRLASGRPIRSHHSSWKLSLRSRRKVAGLSDRAN